MYRLFIVLTSAIIWGACSPHQVDCSGVMCTMEFRSINVAIVDNNQNHKTVDAIKLYDSASSTLLKTVTALNSFDNTYTLVQDGETILSINKPRNLKAEFITNGQVVETAFYTFTRDCCHVSKISGPNTVVVP